MTQLYIDSADTAEWRNALDAALVRRATCNPLLMGAAGWPVTLDACRTLVDQARHIGLSELHVQAWPDDQDDWTPVALAIAALAPFVVVKLPAVPAAMRAARELKRQGARVLITAISNPLHGLWAAEIGADFVAPYVGRLQESGSDAHALIDALVRLQDQGGPVVLAASIRHLDTLRRLVIQGVGAVTLRWGLLAQAINDSATLAAVEDFERTRRASQGAVPQK